jgi:citrate synthase
MEERKLPSGYVKETYLAKIKALPVVFGCGRTAGWMTGLTIWS